MKQSSEIRARQEPGDRAHVILLVALVSFVALMALAAAAGARGPLYRFIDEAGVIHFSNAPPDDRYRVISLKPTGLHLSQRRNPPGETRFDPIIRSAALAQGLWRRQAHPGDHGREGLVRPLAERRLSSE